MSQPSYEARWLLTLAELEGTKMLNAALAAENERLRKAGDELLGNYYVALSDVSDFEKLPSVAQWLAAKEGRDAK